MAVLNLGNSHMSKHELPPNMWIRLSALLRIKVLYTEISYDFKLIRLENFHLSLLSGPSNISSSFCLCEFAPFFLLCLAFFSLSITLSRFIHVVAWIRTSLLFMAK